jgi:hypothetical protein
MVIDGWKTVLAGFNVPDPSGSIPATSENPSAIGTERSSQDKFVMYEIR